MSECNRTFCMSRRLFVIFSMVILLVFGLFLLNYVPYDTEWMKGKTLAEVIERYGLPDYGGREGVQDDLVYEFGFHDFLVIRLRHDGKGYYGYPNTIYHPESVVVSVEVERYFFDTEERDPYNVSGLFLSWAEGKSLDELLSLEPVPVYCVPGEMIVYKLKYDYEVISLKLEEKNGVYAYWVDDGVRCGNIYLDDRYPNLQPWDPDLFPIELKD